MDHGWRQNVNIYIICYIPECVGPHLEAKIISPGLGLVGNNSNNHNHTIIVTFCFGNIFVSACHHHNKEGVGRTHIWPVWSFPVQFWIDSEPKATDEPHVHPHFMFIFMPILQVERKHGCVLVKSLYGDTQTQQFFFFCGDSSLEVSALLSSPSNMTPSDPFVFIPCPRSLLPACQCPESETWQKKRVCFTTADG